MPLTTEGQVPVVNRDEYTIFVEYIPSQPDRAYWLHCTVRRWSHTVARRIYRDLGVLIEMTGAGFFVAVALDDHKLARFTEMMGFVETDRIDTAHGERRQYERTK